MRSALSHFLSLFISFLTKLDSSREARLLSFSKPRFMSLSTLIFLCASCVKLLLLYVHAFRERVHAHVFCGVLLCDRVFCVIPSCPLKLKVVISFTHRTLLFFCKTFFKKFLGWDHQGARILSVFPCRVCSVRSVALSCEFGIHFSPNNE